MKKVYTKPSLFAERFALAEHIAGCSNVVNFDMDSCGAIKINDMTLFNTGCGSYSDSWWEANDVAPGERSFEKLDELGIQCYNAATSPSALFVS